jgi:hypothetical protein
MIKHMSLVRRSARVAPDEFARCWRQEARTAAATMPADVRPRRLAHCVVRHGRQPAEYDGVAIEWHADDDARAGHDRWLTEHAPSSTVDGAATTIVRVEERTVFGDAWLEDRWRHHPGTPQLLLIGLIEAADGMTRAEFRDYWWTQHRPLANQLVPPALQPVAYTHNYLLPGEASGWAGIGEMYEASLDVARQRGAWFAGPAAAALLADEDRFLVRTSRRLLITEQHLIINEGVIP